MSFFHLLNAPLLKPVVRLYSDVSALSVLQAVSKLLWTCCTRANVVSLAVSTVTLSQNCFAIPSSYLFPCLFSLSSLSFPPSNPSPPCLECRQWGLCIWVWFTMHRAGAQEGVVLHFWRERLEVRQKRQSVVLISADTVARPELSPANPFYPFTSLVFCWVKSYIVETGIFLLITFQGKPGLEICYVFLPWYLTGGSDLTFWQWNLWLSINDARHARWWNSAKQTNLVIFAIAFD